MSKVTVCLACGGVARKTKRALVIPSGKMARVCLACARKGVLVVAQLLTMRPLRKARAAARKSPGWLGP